MLGIAFPCAKSYVHEAGRFSAGGYAGERGTSETAILTLIGVVLGGLISFGSQWWLARQGDNRDTERQAEVRRIAEADRVRVSQKHAIASLQEAIFEVYEEATLLAKGRLQRAAHPELVKITTRLRGASYRVARYAYWLPDREATLAILTWRGLLLNQYSGRRPASEEHLQAMYELMQLSRDGFNEYLGRLWQAVDRDHPSAITLFPELSAPVLAGKMQQLNPDLANVVATPHDP